MANPLKIVFAYRARQRHMGGKTMRVDQLVAATGALAPEVQVTAHRIPPATQPRKRRRFLSACTDALVIFHKNAAMALDPDAREILKSKAAVVAVDHLDWVAAPLEPAFFDLHIAASRAGAAELWKARDQLMIPSHDHIKLLPHHWDPRLEGLRAPQDRLRLGYFGLLSNTEMPPHLVQRALIPDYDGKGTDKDSFLTDVAKANLHYGVRLPAPQLPEGFVPRKPFTKGFTAAAVGANIILNRSVDDAEYLLGDDYPFFIDDTSDQAVEAGLKAAKDAFGGPIWAEASDRMAALAAATSVHRVVAHLQGIARQVLG